MAKIRAYVDPVIPTNMILSIEFSIEWTDGFDSRSSCGAVEESRLMLAMFRTNGKERSRRSRKPQLPAEPS